MRWVVLSICLLAFGCTACESGRSPDGRDSPGYPVPVAGLPLPGHGSARRSAKMRVRQLSRDELLAVAYDFYPRLDPADHTSYEFDDLFERSPEQRRLHMVKRAARARLALWMDLVSAVDDALGRRQRGFFVMEQTHPDQDPAYGMLVDLIGQPTANGSRSLFVYVSQLVPYYYYCERHTRVVSGRNVYSFLPQYRISRDFEPVVALIESLIAWHYGYFRLDSELAEVPIPGIYIPDHNGDGPPRFRDALFGPRRRW